MVGVIVPLRAGSAHSDAPNDATVHAEACHASWTIIVEAWLFAISIGESTDLIRHDWWVRMAQNLNGECERTPRLREVTVDL